MFDSPQPGATRPPLQAIYTLPQTPGPAQRVLYSTGITPYGQTSSGYAFGTHIASETPTRQGVQATSNKRKKESPCDREKAAKRHKGKPLSQSNSERNDLQKLSLFFGFLRDELDMSYGELLYKTSIPFVIHFKNDGGPDFDSKNIVDSGGQWSSTGKQMVAVMRHFFEGNGKYPPAKTIEKWQNHSYGRLERESDLMFSTETPYTDIRPIRPALSSFAMQTMSSALLREAEQAVKVESGLHVTLSDKKSAAKRIEWTDIGLTMLDDTKRIIQKHQPLTWELVTRIAARPPRTRNGVTAERIKRPLDLVATGVISTLNFSRSMQAKLLPLATGLLFFGSQVSCDVFRYQSRMGVMPSYSSVTRTMKALSAHEAAVTLAHGQDPKMIGITRLDNVQNYHFQRDPGIGRENKLNIGLAATYYEIDLDGTDVSVFDLEKKDEAIKKGLRKTLTVNALQDLIDSKHLAKVCALQCINALAQNIPHLAHLKAEVSSAYKNDVAKQRLPVKASKIHPLASSGRNETIITELKDALVDFLGQTGQSKDSFKPRLFPVGGDGLTYEKMIQLSEYLQFHPNDFEAMRILQPVLEWWHTEWTNLSRVFECHWGRPLTDDPSTLGHSAARIGRKKPTNLKKVDFYTSTDLAYMVLDVRLLDCWRLHFKTDNIESYFLKKAEENTLPTFAELHTAALEIYSCYISHRAQDKAMLGRGFDSASSGVPKGTTWTAVQPVPAIPEVQPETTQTSKKKKKDKNAHLFRGDQVLAKSIAFMRDTMLAREMTLATAQGDVGRIWEVIKVMVFTFAGSSHSKYTHYLLEMITDLEFESSPELRHAMLQLTLVNLRGLDGHWAGGDFIQEFFNRFLEAVGQRKGIEYGDKFMRDTWSRNIHHISRLKLEWLEGVGLKRRVPNHIGAKKMAEIRILQKLYKETELHSFRAGRIMDEELFIDDFEKGMKKLQGGKLRRWVKRTTRARGLYQKRRVDVDAQDGSESESDESDESDLEEGDSGQERGTSSRLRFAAIVDGDLILDGLDAQDIAGGLGVDDEDDDEDDDEGGREDGIAA